MRAAKVSLDDSDYIQFKRQAAGNPSHNFKLSLVQQPLTGKAISNGLRARGMKWPIEPPPVLELTSPEKDAQKWLYIHNPNWFCVADLICIETFKKPNAPKDNKEGIKDNLSGLLASSLHKVKNPDDRTEHGYFVFGDLNVRDPGRYKLEFTLFEMRRYDAQVYAAKVDSIVSNPFDVNNKTNVQAKDSTKLSKTLSESGVKIRLRKESVKRKHTQFNWSSTTVAECTYSAAQPPQTLATAPTYPPMGHSSIPQHSMRHSGVDVTARVNIVQNMTGPNRSQGYLPAPPDGREQHQVSLQNPYSPIGSMHMGRPEYQIQQPQMYRPMREPAGMYSYPIMPPLLPPEEEQQQSSQHHHHHRHQQQQEPQQPPPHWEGYPPSNEPPFWYPGSQ